jgi:DNA-binding SARP family transcriptional activator
LDQATAIIPDVLPLLERPGITPLIKAWWRIQYGYYYYWLGRTKEAHRILGEALEIVEENGLGFIKSAILLHRAFFSLRMYDLKGAETSLRDIEHLLIPSRFVDRAIHVVISGMIELHRGNCGAATKCARHAEQLIEKSGVPIFAHMANILLIESQAEVGGWADVLGLVQEGKQRAQLLRSKLVERDICLSEAYYYLNIGEFLIGTEALRAGLAINRAEGYVGCVMITPRVLSILLAHALREGIEVEHVQRIIRCTGLRPEGPDTVNWPWPIRIFTLGQFSIIKHESPVEFSSKAPKKLIHLIKAIVALGGKDVPEHVLTELLWPDDEGDVAANSFGVNLHRLRKLLGETDAVQLHAGQVGFNPDVCWMDAWACERLMDRAQEAFKLGRIQEAVSLTEQALRLYRGNFLHADTEAPWSLSARERLRMKFTDCVVSLGTHLEESERLDHAIEYYKKGLEADSLGEAFYQGLMRCYLKLDRRVDGLAVYRRLRELLSITLGIPPSPASQTLFEALRTQ